jgi:phage tail sheath protein FI
MAISPTYPGVYIQEKSSGVRTIMGVPTSVTAFIGRASRGPTDADGPVTINNYGDYQRIFGRLSLDSPMSFAVRDFYDNGGGTAVIVRLFRSDPLKPDKAKILVPIGFTLEAAYPGSWGNALRARVDTNVSDVVAKRYKLAVADLFNLTLCDTETGTTEVFRNLTIKESPTKADRVLKNQSELARVAAGGLMMPNAHAAAPAAGKTLWNDDNCSTGVAAADNACDGLDINEASFTGGTNKADKRGLYTLDSDKVDIFNLLCIPPFYLGDGGDITKKLVSDAADYCESRRAMLIVDPPADWTTKAKAAAARSDLATAVGTTSSYAALFFPRLRKPNPLRDGQVEEFVPCGAVAGIFCRTDRERGVWKAPAGLAATIKGIAGFSVPLIDAENGELNPGGINCLRMRPGAGPVIWGARTLEGDDRLASDWKYIPVRRTALYIEESLYRSTQWVVFEPNDEPLWSQIRMNIGAFMHDLFLQGAFKGTKARDAYYVKCGSDTTTQNDINKGIVNIEVGFAPLKPAEFVIITIQQMAGQIQT